MHAHMPTIEIAFGETFRAASQAVAVCAHFRLRVAMGRRSPSSAAELCIVELKSIADLENNTQMKAGECGPHANPSSRAERGTSQSKDWIREIHRMIDHQ